MDNPLDESLPLLALRQIDRLCDEYEVALRAGQRVAIADFLSLEHQSSPVALLGELLAIKHQVLSEPAESETAASAGRRRIVLEVLAGASAGRELSFDEQTSFVIGRANEAGLRLLDDRHVGKRHCRLVVDPPVCRLEDLGSRNGTAVNGRRVRTRILQDGDIVRIGATEIAVSVIGKRNG